MRDLSESHRVLVEEINQDIPSGVDWTKGACDYVANVFKANDPAKLEQYIRTKPMYNLPTTDASRSLEEAVQYLNHFVNTLKLLDLPAGKRWLDVACGAGWMSHYARRFGYETFGIDISADFINYARERLRRDPDLTLPEAEIEGSFAVHDIQAEALPEAHRGRYDAIVLESCLHHFVDPVVVLRHLTEALAPGGLMVIIEGENRQGPINPAYMDVMRQYDTLERPYFRHHLFSALDLAGLSHRESVGELNGYFSPRDPIWGDATARLRETAHYKNLTVCARDEGALERVFPFRRTAPPL